MIVAMMAPANPRRLNNGNIKNVVLLFCFLTGCGSSKSTMRTSSATVVSTNSGAMRPQSAADAVYVNDIENSQGNHYLINALVKFCNVFTTDGSIKNMNEFGSSPM